MTSTLPTTLQTIDALPDDAPYLKELLREVIATLLEDRQHLQHLQQRLAELTRRLFGPRRERVNPDQGLLFAEPGPSCATPPSESAAAGSAAEQDAGQPKKKRQRGRNELPTDLPRERIEHTLTTLERLCPCCGKLRTCIGTTTSSQLEYEPASLYVVEHVEHAYACRECEGEVIRASKPAAPIGKGLPGPGLLAYLTVSKFADHLPLYRLERILQRHGLELARSTMCDWLAHCADLLRPLYQEMHRRILTTRVIHTDDTVLPVLDRQRASTRQGRLWCYLGDWMNPYNVFSYTPDRRQEGPQKFLQGFTGFLQADAYAGYDRVFKKQGVVEVACNAHARRKFYEAKSSDPERAHQALAYYRQLYKVEEEIRMQEQELRATLRPEDEPLFSVWWQEQVVLLRGENAWPVWLYFHDWLEKQKKSALPKSPLGEAITYALNQFQALTEYVYHGFLVIDNNWCEREMKKVAIGRKNYLFSGSDAGGATAAVLYSLVSTCQRHGIDPLVYLRDVYRRLPTQSADRLEELLPDRWQPLPDSPRLSAVGTPPAGIDESSSESNPAVAGSSP